MLRKRLLVYLILLMLIVTSCGGGPPASKPTGSVSGLLISAGTIGQDGSSIENYDMIDFTDHGLNANVESNIISGEYLITFKDGISSQSISTLNVAGTELKQISWARYDDLTIYFYKADINNELQSASLKDELENNINIESITENRILQYHKVPNDEFYPIQWHYPSLNLPAAWDITTGNAIVVGVVDSGIVPHPDMNILPGYDIYQNDSNPTDENGDVTNFHGTHVAGTIGAIGNNSGGVSGVNWAAKIVPVRVGGPKGSININNELRGIIWAAGGKLNGLPQNQNPARVINMSIGGKGKCSSIENQVYKKLIDDGIIVVISAGNDNEDANNYSPANCDNVITVGATGPKGQRAPYSNYGSVIDVMAPGGDFSQKISVGGKDFPAAILSTSYSLEVQKFSFSFLQGTSMASPHVAGIISLMLSKEPNLTPSQVLARLKAAGRTMSASDCKRSSGADCGAGLIDAAKALGDSGTTPPPKPPPTTNTTTYVVAFYCTDDTNCIPYDSDRTRLISVKQDSSSVLYKLSGLEEGRYLVAGFQDINDNGKVDDSEPLGAYPNFVNLKSGQNLGGVTIHMKPSTANGQSETIEDFDSFNQIIKKLSDLRE